MSTEVKTSARHRRSQLLEHLAKHEHVSIEEICEIFSVSPATARRDLKALSDWERVQRVHGGAISTRNTPPEPPLGIRSTAQAAEKRRIGQAAGALVRDGDSVFLGSGTTVLQVAQHLQDHRNLTVITNSYLILDALRNASGIELVCVGGYLRRSELSFIGHITELALTQVHVNKVILGIHAIDIEAGLTNDYFPETQTDRAILKIGREVIVVADHTKCGRVSPAFVAPISVMSRLVTDSATPDEFVKAVEAHDVHVTRV